MIQEYHVYTENELKHAQNQSPINLNWKPPCFITCACIDDASTGVRDYKFIAFNNKLIALYYFRNLIVDIKDGYANKDYFLKISTIDHCINSIKSSKNDKDINLNIVDFEINDLSLCALNSGYWKDSSSLILKQIIDEIDTYFDFKYDDEIEDDDSVYSTASLKNIQNECQALINHQDIFSEIYIEKFNKLCQYMNDFWDFWFE